MWCVQLISELHMFCRLVFYIIAMEKENPGLHIYYMNYSGKKLFNILRYLHSYNIVPLMRHCKDTRMKYIQQHLIKIFKTAEAAYMKRQQKFKTSIKLCLAFFPESLQSKTNGQIRQNTRTDQSQSGEVPVLEGGVRAFVSHHVDALSQFYYF